jgi:hypothetical protein
MVCVSLSLSPHSQYGNPGPVRVVRRFDAEHSYNFGGGWRNPPMGHRWVTCRIICLWTSVPDHIYLKQSVLYTYTATRPLRALYFDGFSAAKTPEGTLDSQDILLYGEVGDWRHPHDDYDRGASLCEWGREFGIEGFVREEATFEVRCYHQRQFPFAYQVYSLCV